MAQEGSVADSLIAREIDRQDAMWGASDKRADISKGQLMRAAFSQILALGSRQEGNEDAFASPPGSYPSDWSGFRDYGSDIANLVVAAAFIRQEIKRKLMAGEDMTRASRDPETQPYDPNQTSGLPKKVD